MSVHNIDNFLSRALKTFFLGYSMTQKGYRLYNLDTQSFHVSRHVTFVENVFPFATISPQSFIYPFTPPETTTGFDVGLPISPFDIFTYLNTCADTLASSSYIVPTLSPTTSSPNTTTFSSSNPDLATNVSISPAPPTQRISLRNNFKSIWFKDYITSTGAAKANTILLDCPINTTKYKPDITYVVHHLSQCLQAPRAPHMLVVQHVLRYL